jgi:hypothetical protein
MDAALNTYDIDDLVGATLSSLAAIAGRETPEQLAFGEQPDAEVV